MEIELSGLEKGKNRLSREKSHYLMQHAETRWTGIPGEKRHLTRPKERISLYSCQ